MIIYIIIIVKSKLADLQQREVLSTSGLKQYLIARLIREPDSDDEEEGSEITWKDVDRSAVDEALSAYIGREFIGSKFMQDFQEQQRLSQQQATQKEERGKPIQEQQPYEKHEVFRPTEFGKLSLKSSNI